MKAFPFLILSITILTILACNSSCKKEDAASSREDEQIGKTDVEKVINYINCRCVEFLLEERKNQINKICEQNPTDKEIQDIIPENEKKIHEFSTEISKLKKDNSIENAEEIFQIIFTNGNIANLWNYLISGKDYSAFKSNLEKNIKKNFDSELQADRTNDLMVQIDNLEQRLEIIEKNNNRNMLIVLFLLAISFLLFFNYNPIKKIILKLLKNKPRVEPSNSIKDTDNSLTIQDLINDRTFHETVSKIVLPLVRSEIEKKLVEHNKQTSTNLELNVSKEVSTEEKKPEVNIFYLSTPNSDGSFNESSISLLYKEGASIYRFMKTGHNTANFLIDEKEASIKLALQYPDKNIDPVCDAENAYNPNAKRITTIDMGKAELVGGKWIKNSKAKIRYEG